MSFFDEAANEISNVGVTIICIFVGVFIINWLDRNVFNKNRRHKHDKWD